MISISGSPKIEVSKLMQYLQSQTESGRKIDDVENLPVSLDYELETKGINLSSENPVDQYAFLSEISR